MYTFNLPPSSERNLANIVSNFLERSPMDHAELQKTLWEDMQISGAMEDLLSQVQSNDVVYVQGLPEERGASHRRVAAGFLFASVALGGHQHIGFSHGDSSEFHTKQATTDMPPQYVAFFHKAGERHSPKVLTANFSKIYLDLHENHPYITDYLDSPLPLQAQDKKVEYRPIMGADGIARFDKHAVVEGMRTAQRISNEQLAVAMAVEESAVRQQESFTLERGQALIINNHHVLHAHVAHPALQLTVSHNIQG